MAWYRRNTSAIMERLTMISKKMNQEDGHFSLKAITMQMSEMTAMTR